MGFVNSLESIVEYNQLLLPEQILLFLLVYNKAFLEQSTPYLLTEFVLARQAISLELERTYTVYLFSVLLRDDTTGRSSERSKKPLRLAIQGVGSHPGVERSITSKGIEAKEIPRSS